MLALSATFSAEALAGVEALMRRPQRVLLAPGSVSLLGVRQFYALVPGTRPACCPAQLRGAGHSRATLRAA